MRVAVPRIDPAPAFVVALLLGVLSTFAPPAYAAESAPAAPATPDFASYQALLDEYLVVTSAKGKPLETRFNYEALYLARGRYERFSRIRRALLAVPPSAMDDPTRLAWAINTYNFLVIENATNNLIVPRRGLLRHKGVKDMNTSEGSFFVRPVVEIEGAKYSLDAFERAFVFPGYTPEPGTTPPAGFDPRPHFAVVCGAMSCPPLQPQVYDPKRIGEQLDAAVTGALRNPAHLAWDEAKSELRVTSIFDWYAPDFGGFDGAFAFLVRHAPAAVRNGITKRKLTGVTGYLPWDWDLNQAPEKIGG